MCSPRFQTADDYDIDSAEIPEDGVAGIPGRIDTRQDSGGALPTDEVVREDYQCDSGEGMV